MGQFPGIARAIRLAMWILAAVMTFVLCLDVHWSGKGGVESSAAVATQNAGIAALLLAGYIFCRAVSFALSEIESMLAFTPRTSKEPREYIPEVVPARAGGFTPGGKAR